MNTIELANAKYEAKKYLGEIESASVIQDSRMVIKNLLFFLDAYAGVLSSERLTRDALKAHDLRQPTQPAQERLTAFEDVAALATVGATYPELMLYLQSEIAKCDAALAQGETSSPRAAAKENT